MNLSKVYLNIIFILNFYQEVKYKEIIINNKLKKMFVKILKIFFKF